MMVGHLTTLLVLNLIYYGFGFPLNSLVNPKVPPAKVLEFLKKYGYIEKDDSQSGALYTETGISETIKTVQKFGALEETGILDNETLTLMTSPRCGVPDIINNKRRKRYVLGSEGWNKRTITYFIANWSPKIGEESVIRNIQLALDTWGKYGHLRFIRRLTPDVDIIVAFGSSYHGDIYPFDGPGNILAHAFFPYEDQGFGGDIHFDADEDWTDLKNGGKEDGMDFLTVALHELGHSLGLSHSPVPTAVMFPYYRGYDPNVDLQLGYDDILGMYELYIRRNINDSYYPTTDKIDNPTTPVTTTRITTTYSPEESTTITSAETIDNFTIPTTPTTTTPVTSTTQYQTSTISTYSEFITTESIIYEGDDESVDNHKEHDTKHHIPSTNSPSLPNICDGFFDAVAILRDEIFIFKEQYVWRLKRMGKIEKGYPILITQMFPELPQDIKKIDAAYERPDGMIVLFTGDEFWVYDGKQFIENTPLPLSYYGLPEELDKIDAVQVWAKNGKTYIYRENIFWRYNETTKTMDEGYPKDMERWRGVPPNLDAAATYKGITYFFKDELYWKFDNDWVIATDKSPLPSPQIWLGCPEDDNTFLRLRNDYT